MKTLRPALIWTLAAGLTLGSLPVRAELIATPELVGPVVQDARAPLAATLARADVAAALRAQGVDPAALTARVQALTDDEAAHLAQRLEQLPAGGSDVLGTIVFIFVLLLVTDILGFTKVFPFTRAIR
ncbi:MAG: hypothetical protein Fur0014_11800 [Rubrivivax sp.]